ncbi:hypothetical protein VTI74DRAFT_7804 [Chaetomium olivicolor]
MAQIGWHLDAANIVQIWRQGCIIKGDAIINLLDHVYPLVEHDPNNLLSCPTIACEAQGSYLGLTTVLRADMHVPAALSASIEYYKYSEETELDYFGAHMFRLETEASGKPEKGSHQF